MLDFKQINQSFLCVYLLALVRCVHSKTALVGGRGGGHAQVSDNWGVLSQGTQIFLLVLGVILALFSLYGLYKLCRWCKIDPRKAGQKNIPIGMM